MVLQRANCVHFSIFLLHKQEHLDQIERNPLFRNGAHGIQL